MHYFHIGLSKCLKRYTLVIYAIPLVAISFSQHFLLSKFFIIFALLGHAAWFFRQHIILKANNSIVGYLIREQRLYAVTSNRVRRLVSDVDIGVLNQHLILVKNIHPSGQKTVSFICADAMLVAHHHELRQRLLAIKQQKNKPELNASF